MKGSVHVHWAAYTTLGAAPMGPLSVSVAAVQDDEEVRDVRTKDPFP